MMRPPACSCFCIQLALFVQQQLQFGNRLKIFRSSAKEADVLIHEATFAHADAQMAFDRLHSTSTMAAQVALGAGVKELIMTHFSPRYAPGNALGLDDLLQEAKAIFPHTRLAYDFYTHTVPRRR